MSIIQGTAEAVTSDEGPVASWWAPRHEASWLRARPELERTARRQRMASGTLPPERVDDLDPTPRPDWETALAALRLGHGSASYYLDEYAWGEELDLAMARDWTVMRTGIPWSQVRNYARLAWELAHRLLENQIDRVVVDEPSAAH
jgi:hypothetical protein